MQRPGQRLHPVDEGGSGLHDVARRVDRDERHAGQSRRHGRALGQRPVEPVAARGDHGDVGDGQVGPRRGDAALAGKSADGLSARAAHQLRNPMACEVGRVGPLQHEHAGPRPVRHRAFNGAIRARRRPVSAPAASAAAAADPTAVTASSTSSRLCGSSVNTSASVPMTRHASATVAAGSAQTRHRSWVRMRSGAAAASAARSSS